MSNEIMCADWCGFGCTKAAHDQAEAEAAALATLMGAGWEPRVWENAGWHYEVKKGLASITPDTDGKAIAGGWKVLGYRAYLDTAPQARARATDPLDALGFAQQDARGAQQRIAAALDFIAT